MAAALALAADRISAGPAGPGGARGADAIGDIGGFVSAGRGGPDAVLPRYDAQLRVDPFDGARLPGWISVASPQGTPTVSRNGSARQLTAILIADDKPVAVVDGDVVGVGDVLRDGARISGIQADRVFVVEKNGTWRTLTLSTGKP